MKAVLSMLTGAFGISQIQLFVVFGVALSALGAFGYHKYVVMTQEHEILVQKNTISVLEGNIVTLKGNVDAATKANLSLQDSIARLETQNKELLKLNEDAAAKADQITAQGVEQTRAAEDLFNKAKSKVDSANLFIACLFDNFGSDLPCLVETPK